MSRLIDANALNKSIEEEFDGVCTYDVSPSTAVSDFQQIVGAQPTIEAVPVVYGEWKFDISGAGHYYCSVCGGRGDFYGKYNYCPNCGARMKGKAE